MKKIRLILVAFAALTLVTSFSLSGCSKMGGTKIKISSWGDPEENKILSDLIAQYMQKHPGVQVELQRIPFNEYVTKLLTQIAGGLAPDVIFVEVNNFVDMYLRGALEPLNPYIQADHLDLSAYYPQVVDRFTVDNQTYVIPRDTAPIGVIYYNKNAFDEAGIPYPNDNWNWADFVKAGQKITKKDATGKVTRWGFVDDWPLWDAWVYDAGGAFTDNVKHPTRWTFALDPDALRGVQFRADLMNKYKVMLPPSGLAAMGGMGTSDMFVNGTVGMFLSGIWKTPKFRPITNFKWDVVMFPKNMIGYRAFSTGGSGYGILKSSTHKKEAWDLVKYISGEEGAKMLAATGLAQPAIMSAANSPLFLDGKDPQNKKMLFEAMKYVKYNPMCKNWAEVHDSIIGPELDKVWNGTETAAEAMQKLRPLLEKNPPQTN
ncbi:MAG TPA: sugar ABC transporter substrate-binding protein [bacterium]|nr:sugar ABC transporter substrate-binding protein [bacterium]